MSSRQRLRLSSGRTGRHRWHIAANFTISGPSISRHLSILRAAGLVTERRDANRIFYSLVPDRLAVCVGSFLSAVSPEQFVLRQRRNRAPAPKPKEPHQ